MIALLRGRPGLRIFRKFQSIRTAMFFVLIIAILPAVAIIQYTGSERISHMKADARENTLRQIETIAEIQTRITAFTRQTLVSLAGLPMVRTIDPVLTRTILNGLREANPDFINFTITDRNGVVVSSALLGTGADLSDRKSIRDSLNKNGFAAGEFVISRALQEPSFNFSQAITDKDGNIIGAVGAIYRLSIYATVLDKLRLPKDSILGITDHRGVRLFFHPAKETNPIGSPIKADMWKILQEGGDSGTTEIAGSDGIRRIYAYKKLRLSPSESPYMYFVMGIPETAVMASSRSVIVRSMILIFLVLLLTLAVAWGLSELIFARRLKAIIAATNCIRAGDFASRTGVPGDNTDLGRVAEALDRMAEKLELREAEQDAAARTLKRSLQEKETLLREVHHRVKNNLQVILSLVRLQGNANVSAHEFSRLMETRISAMALVHEMLYLSDNLSQVDMAAYTSRLADLLLTGGENPSSIKLSMEVEPLSFPLERAIPFALAFTELISNARKHAARDEADSHIYVSLRRRGGSCVLRVADNGPGLPPGFVPRATAGLGMQLILGLTHQLGGSLRWENDGGAVFILECPGPNGSDDGT